MSRVALVLPNLAAGGAERTLVDVGLGWAAAGHEVTLVVGSAVGPLAPGLPRVDLGAPRMARAVVPLARWLRRYRPEAVVSALTHANVATLLAWRAAGRPGRVLVTEHTAASVADPRTRVVRALARRTYGMAEAVGVVDGALAEAAPRLFGRAAVRLPLVVDEGSLRRQAARPAGSPWGPSDHRRMALVVGRLVAGKRVGAVIEAVGSASWPADLTLGVLGDGPLRGELTRQVREAGLADRVAIVGHVDEVGAWMARASVLVIPSAQETGPRVALEAAALGLPIVATPCSERLRAPGVVAAPIHDLSPAGIGAAVREGLAAPSRGWRPMSRDEAVGAWAAAVRLGEGLSACGAG